MTVLHLLKMSCEGSVGAGKLSADASAKKESEIRSDFWLQVSSRFIYVDVTRVWNLPPNVTVILDAILKIFSSNKLSVHLLVLWSDPPWFIVVL